MTTKAEVLSYLETAIPDPQPPPPPRRKPSGHYLLHGLGDDPLKLPALLDKYPMFSGVVLQGLWGANNPKRGNWDFSTELALLDECGKRGKGLIWWSEIKSFNGLRAISPAEWPAVQHKSANGFMAPLLTDLCVEAYCDFLVEAGRMIGTHQVLQGVDTSETAPGDLIAKTNQSALSDAWQSIYRMLPQAFDEVTTFACVNWLWKSVGSLAFAALAAGNEMSATDALDTDGTKARHPTLAQASYYAVQKQGSAQAIFDWAKANQVAALSWYITNPALPIDQVAKFVEGNPIGG